MHPRRTNRQRNTVYSLTSGGLGLVESKGLSVLGVCIYLELKGGWLPALSSQPPSDVPPIRYLWSSICRNHVSSDSEPDRFGIPGWKFGRLLVSSEVPTNITATFTTLKSHTTSKDRRRVWNATRRGFLICFILSSSKSDVDSFRVRALFECPIPDTCECHP